MKKTSKALASTAALCLVLSTTSALAAETSVAPERLAGANRVSTAISIAQESFNGAWNGSGKAILSASADINLVDSLAVAPLSYQLKAPILLNDAKNSINAETLKTLKDKGVKTVYIATGTGVISDKAKSQLEKEGMKVERLGGKDRYETAKNILDTFKKNGGSDKTVALVSGSGLADALSVAPEAAAKGMPILLTNGKDAVASNLQEVAKAAEKVYAIGGNGVISDALLQQLKAERLGGSNRYETNALVIKEFASDKAFSKIYLGNGQDAHLVDSLTGSVLAAQSGSPIVLADGKLADITKETLKGKINEKTGIVALGGEAVVSNDLVKEVVEIAKPGINKVAVESVVSLNETSVQVKGLAKDTKEADLKDKKIELKAGDVILTAKYVASSLTEDGKANFVLESNKKLVDATEYTVESDWTEFVVNKFVAKVANAYVKTINVTTKAIQGQGNNKVYFAAKNQYGEAIAVNGNVADVKATATINGVPVKADEISIADINDGYVTIVKELKEGDKVVINFTNTIADKDVQVGTASFTAVKAETSVSTTISDMKAEYTNAANGHELNKEAKEVLPDDQVKLTVKILDQFGNSMAAGTKARWVVESGKDLVTKTNDTAIDEVSDAENFTLKAVKAGSLKVSAFLANGEKVTYEVKVGAKQLAQLNVAAEAGVNLASAQGINHEEEIIGAVTPNAGAILTADMIKFDIKATKTSEEVTAADVQVVAKLRGGDGVNKNDIVIAVKSSKAGKYVITPYVGESVEKGIKGSIITVTTTIDQNVASIDDINFDAAELKVGSQIKKDVVFRNKYKEVVVLNDGQADVIVTPAIASAADNAKVTKDTDKNKNVLTLKVDGEKTYNVVVKNGDVIRAFNLTFKAPAFTAVELGNDVTGVVAGDPEDKAKYQAVKFLDQDGKSMSVKKEDIKVSVTKPDGQSLANVADLITLGKTYTVNEAGVVTFEAAANNEDNVVAIKVAPADAIVAGTYTVKVEDKDGKIVDTLNITVGAKRVVKTVEVKPEATKVVLGGKTKVTIVPKDQYGEFVAVGTAKVEAVPGANFGAGAVTQINKDGGVVDGTHPVAAYQVELTGNTKGTNDVVVNIKDDDNKVLSTNKVSMTVDSASSLIDSVTVDTKDIKALYSTQAGASNVNLKAIVKAVDGTVIPVSANDLDWKVISQKDSDGKDVAVKTITVNAQTGVVTAPKDTIGSAVVEVTTANMKKATITLKFDNKAAVAQTGTVQVINTEKDEQDKILPLDADDKKEGIQISLDNDAKDGEKAGAVKVVLNAKDQYGNLFGDQNDQILANQITLRVGDSSVVKAEAKDEANKAVITISAKGEGDSKVYVEYAGQTITLDVAANKAAVDEANKAIELAQKQQALEAVKSEAAKITLAAMSPIANSESNAITKAQALVGAEYTVAIKTSENDLIIKQADGVVTHDVSLDKNCKVTFTVTKDGVSVDTADLNLTVARQ